MKKTIDKHILFFALFILILFAISASFFVLLNFEKNKKHNYLFGATYMNMDNPYFEALNNSIIEYVESNGDKLLYRDPARNQAKQNEQIKNMIDKGVDLIFINPVDWKLITPALELCAKHGIPLIAVDTPVERSDLVVSTVLSDNYAAGVLIARDIIRRVKSAEIVILYHSQIHSTNLRTQGVIDTLNKSNFPYHFYKASENSSTLESSMEDMNKFILDNKKFDINIVIGSNDPTALGALAAMQKNKVDKDILVYGIDGSPNAKSMINSGNLTGSSAQFPIKMGELVAHLAYEYLNGKKLEKQIYVPVELITKENISKFDISGWQ